MIVVSLFQPYHFFSEMSWNLGFVQNTVTEHHHQNTHTFIYDGFNCIAEYQGSVGVPPALSKTRLWGLDLSGSMQGAGGVGGLLSEKQNSNLYYPLFDGNGNITEYINSTGSVVVHFEFDPFGNTVVNTDSGNLFNYRFSTKPLDFATGLYYYQYRYYDPLTGRWPSRDPIGERGGVNLHGFCLNQPINGIDRDGDIFWIPVIIVVAVIMDGTANAPEVGRPDIVRKVNPVEVGKVIISPDTIVEEATGIDVPDYIPTRKNIAQCCGMIFGGKDAFKRWAQWKKLTKEQTESASTELHEIKKVTSRGGADNVDICGKTGDVIDKKTGETIGNIEQ